MKVWPRTVQKLQPGQRARAYRPPLPQTNNQKTSNRQRLKTNHQTPKIPKHTPTQKQTPRFTRLLFLFPYLGGAPLLESHPLWFLGLFNGLLFNRVIFLAVIVPVGTFGTHLRNNLSSKISKPLQKLQPLHLAVPRKNSYTSRFCQVFRFSPVK